MKVFILLILSSLLWAEQINEEWFKKLSKTELHLHLGGSFPKDYLFSLSTPKEQQELEKSLERVASGIDYRDCFSVFQLISRLVNTEEKLQKGVEALCIALQNDNVSYVEIRTGLKDLGKGEENYLRAVLDGIKTYTTSSFKAKILLSVQRNSSLKAVQKTVDLALKYQMDGVVGIDLSGDATLGQVESIIPLLLQAKEKGLSFVVHMGEVAHETDQILLLQTLEPKRIGHGVYLTPEAKEWILQRHIPIEVCLTSSLLVKMVNQYNQHPGIDFFKQGHPIVFCTDDRFFFRQPILKNCF